MEKISVIIPVFQTLNYLPETMDSVLSQEFDDFEIILVDDGSTDGSGKLCDEYVQRDARIKVIHQENMGLGLARNSGLKEANGEYVMFLDSDDLLDGPKALKTLYDSAAADRSDVVQGNYRRYSDGEVKSIQRHNLDGLNTRSRLFRFRGFYQNSHLSFSWGKLYRRAFLIDNDLWQKPYPFTQDKAHSLMVLSKHPKYSFIDSSVVLYRVNTSSTTFKYKENYGKKWKSIAADLKQYLIDTGADDDLMDMIALHYFSGANFVAKQELLCHKDSGNKAAKAALKEYFSNDVDAKKAIRKLAFGCLLPFKAPLYWHLAVKIGSLLLALKAYNMFIVVCKMEMNKKTEG